ncbi:ATP-binding cassette domain-containing protein, partial [bacterium]|nr:ATP-binding cassette domain-containing protein [bacterium]
MKRRIALSGVIAPTISFADFSTLVNNSNTRSTYAPITEEDAKVILGVVRLLPTFESLPSLNIHGKKLILILGKTGAGKSTLLNYLTGTVYKYDEATERMVAQNQERAGTSASKTESHTQIPNVFSIPGSDFCYVDCAGFGDTKGKEYDVLLALFLRRLVKTNTIAHVIWVVSDTTISANRGQTFINQFSALKPLFGPEHHKRLPLTIAVNAVQDPDNVSSLISG